MRAQTFTTLAVAVVIGKVNAWTDSAVHEIVLPTVEPTATRDPWQCVIANLTQYFDVPKPTGALLDALDSYGDKLIESCTVTGVDRINGGCFPAKTKWCDFTTAAPTSVLADYQLYGNAASSWWAASSASAVSLAQECPNGWYNAMYELPGGPTWLNETIVFAACRAEAVTTTTPPGSGSASTRATAISPPRVTSVPTASVTPAPVEGVAGRGEDIGWMIASSGLVAAAVESMWNGI